jgi:hypothetical protein
MLQQKWETLNQAYRLYGVRCLVGGSRDMYKLLSQYPLSGIDENLVRIEPEYEICISEIEVRRAAAVLTLSNVFRVT